MRKGILFLILTAVVCGTFGAYAQKPVYIYRNEGFIQTFITEEIDSITYSRIDADSMLRSDYCMTEIHACDTVFRIPIASIDSISFVTPSTILKSGVFNIDEKLSSWVRDRNDLLLYLDPATPANLLPEKDMTIVSLADNESPVKGIFFGKVAEIRSENGLLAIKCDPCYLEDAFERLYASSDGVVVEDSKPLSRSDDPLHRQGWKIWDPEEVKVDLVKFNPDIFSYQHDEDSPFSIGVDELSFSVKPTVKYHASMAFDKRYKPSFSLTIIGDYQFQEKFSFAGTLSFSEDIPVIKPSIPIANGFAKLSFEFGLYGKASVGFAVDKQWNQHYNSVFHFDWSKGAPSSLKPVNTFAQCEVPTEDGNFAISGNISAGIYGEIKVSFLPILDQDLANISLRAEAGVGLEGTWLPIKGDAANAKTNPSFYNKLRREGIQSYFESELNVKINLFEWAEFPPLVDTSIPLSRKTLAQISSVPKFSGTSYTSSDNSLFVSTNATGNVGSNDLGFALAKDGVFAEEDYVYTWKNYKGPNAPLNYVYNGKDPDSDYNVYPLVKWMGIEMIADNTTIIGKWKGDDDLAYEFKADNTFISYEYGHYVNDIEVIAETHGTYTISSDGKYIDFHDEYDERWKYEIVSLSEDVLIINSYGDNITYVRVDSLP